MPHDEGPGAPTDSGAYSFEDGACNFETGEVPLFGAFCDFMAVKDELGEICEV